MKKRLVLLDSHALLHRSYHAMGGFSTRDGRPTGALFGFIKMILKIKDELKPNYLIACFDRKEATFRHEVYEKYKAGRTQADDELIIQINEAPRVCKSLDIPVYSLATFEADDLLGTICEKLKRENFKINGEEIEIYIASGDMDTMQLIDKENHIKVYTLKKGLGETIIYNYQDVFKRFGIYPEQIVDYKALRGDTSDNIIGIKGIGDKIAQRLISLFDSLENIYKKVHENKDGFIKICKSKKEYKLTDRIINLIIEGEDEAIFSQTLATIRRDAPIDLVLPKKGWLKDFDYREFNKICDEFEFRTLKNKFGGDLEINKANEEIKIGGLEGDIILESEKIEDYLLKDLRVLTNLLNSELTNPTLFDILDFINIEKIGDALNILESKVKKEGLWNLYEQVEKPLELILFKMKKNGIHINKELLQRQEKDLGQKLKEIESLIYFEAKEEFNVASSKQLGFILYEKLKLGNKIKKTSGGALSTGAGELEKMRGSHKIIDLILEHRGLSKLLNTYLGPIPNFIEDDGKIHPDFIQTGAATGRFSCENPNLQNLPIKSELGLNIRKAFLASPGYKLISIDYSQIDLRSAAILSQDINLLDIFQKNIDIHTGVAVKVFKVREEEVTKDMRRKAKAINFGIIYGMGVTALKDAMGVERKEAQLFFDEYKNTFTGLMSYLENVKKFAAEKGYTETLLGRRRQMPLLKSKIPFLRSQGERLAINAGIQGTTADILKLAMLDLDDYISKDNLEDKIKILLQIHDELILELPDGLVDQELDNLKKIFENVLIKRLQDKDFKNIFIKNEIEIKNVPLVANVKIGDSLYDLK